MSEDYFDEWKQRQQNKEVQGWELDRSPGNGSGEWQDGHIDEMAEEDPTAVNSTTFHAEDAPKEQRQKYERLWLYNSGCLGNVRNEGAMRRVEKYRWHLFKVLSQRLNLTPQQKLRVTEWIDDFDFGRSGTVTEEAVIFAMVSLSGRVDDRWIDHEDIFRELQSDLDISLSELQKAREQCREVM